MGSCCCKPSSYWRRNPQKKIVLLLVGLDNAGKTTAAKGLAGDIVEITIPTVGFSAIKPKTKGYDVTIYDLGGGPQIRGIWSSYFHCVHGIIFVVDASDISRIEESKTILENLLLHDKLAGKPVLVLANKQDKHNALDEIDIVEVLELEPLVNRQKCHTLVKICSAVPVSPAKKRIDKRLLEGYRWLLNQIVQEYDILKYRVETDSKVEAEKFEAFRALQRKRLEESDKETVESNGAVSNSVQANGVTETITTENNLKNITSIVRDQLEKKNVRQKVLLSRGRKNKVYPENEEDMRDSNVTTSKPFLNSSQSAVETSMTLRALTSPLHNYNIASHPLPKHGHAERERPHTTRSLGCEVGGWGLDRELDVIYPFQVARNEIREGIKDEIIVQYLKTE